MKIPWGAWDMDGNWYPNNKLMMSADEQYMENAKNGYMDIIWSKKINEKFIINCKLNRIYKRTDAIKTIKRQSYYGEVP